MGLPRKAGGSEPVNRLLKNSRNADLVSGHGFNRADKAFIFDFGEVDFSPTSLAVESFSATC